MARGSACVLVLAAVLLSVVVPAGSGGVASARHRNAFAGLGTWVSVYSPAWDDPEAAVAEMAQHHVRTLYLETGNYRHAADVFRADDAGRFIDAAHAAGLRVVAWYLPSFANLERDTRKALAAIRFRSASGQRFNAFALDIEATTVRSLSLRDHRLLQLSARIRRAVRPRYPLGAITPSPIGMSEYFWPDIPYQRLTRDYNAFLPMAYSTLKGIHSRGGTVDYLTSTIDAIRTASGDPAFPIHLIGGLSGSMGKKETAGFLQAVRQAKPSGYSLYAFDQTTPAVWKKLH